jgi:hypothetical protein
MKRALLCWLAAGIPAFAGLTFDEASKQVDTSVDADSVTLDFPFVNSGETPVTIDRYDAGCKCVGVSLKGGKKFYKPGEKGIMRAEFDLSALSGVVHKQIRLWLDGAPEPKPSNVVDVHVNIPVLMEVEPRTVIWETGSIAEAKTVLITVKGDDPIRITSISDGTSKFQRELKTLEEGRKYELAITPNSTESPSFGTFRLETDSPAKRYKVQQVYVFVTKPGVKPINLGEAPATPAKP